MKRIFLFLCATMLTAQAWAAVNFDFSAVSSSGQTLYYKKTSATEVSVVYPNLSGSNYYSGYTKPSGDLVIPQTVTNNNVTYSVTSIGNSAFYDCSGLTTVTIGNSVTSIGERAFQYCSKLSSVTIGNSVVSIGSGAFHGCSKLTEINVESANTKYTSENGVLFNKNKTTIVCYPAGKTETTYTIPNSVTSIGNSAFRGSSKLSSVTIPNSVTSIGGSAFYYCSGLRSVTIPNSVTSIGSYAFRGCSGLTSVTIPNSVTSIGDWAFAYCSGLTSVTIPNSVTSIGSYAFYDCTSLTITIPTTVKLGAYALEGVKKVYYADANGFVYADKVGTQLIRYIGSATSITIPSTVTSIAEGTFDGHPQIFIFADEAKTQLIRFYGTATNVTVPSTVTSIAEGTFAGCSQIEEITLPFVGDKQHQPTDTYQYPFGYIFGKNSYTGSTETTQYYYGSTTEYESSDTYYIPANLKKVTINGSSYIPYNAFYYCEGLTSVTIGNTVTTIGDNAFYYCNGLTSMSIGNSVTSIGKSAFIYCEKLASISIPNSVTSIGDGAFRYCKGLTTISVESGNTAYASENGVLFNKNKTTLLFYPEGKAAASYTIPNTVTTIVNIAFHRCSYLTSVTIPSSVTNIGMPQFQSCSKLSNINVVSGNTVYASENGVLFNKNKTTLVCYPIVVSRSKCNFSKNG